MIMMMLAVVVLFLLLVVMMMMMMMTTVSHRCTSSTSCCSSSGEGGAYRQARPKLKWATGPDGRTWQITLLHLLPTVARQVRDVIRWFYLNMGAPKRDQSFTVGALH